VIQEELEGERERVARERDRAAARRCVSQYFLYYIV